MALTSCSHLSSPVLKNPHCAIDCLGGTLRRRVVHHVQQLRITALLPGNYDFRCDWLEYSADLSYGRFYQRLLFYPLLGIFIGGILKSRADVPNPPVLAVAVILIQNGCSCFCSYRNRPKSVTPDIEIFTSAPFTSTVFFFNF
jgi:hypothetical protein